MINSKLLRFGVHCVVVLCFMVNFVMCETYTSVEGLEKLVDTQKSVMNALDLYINQEMERLSELSKYLESFVDETKTAAADVQRYIENPMNCFLLVKRLTVDLHFVTELASTKIELTLDPESTYPNWKDLTGSALSVARLQRVYQLDVNKLADGVLRGSFSSNRTIHTADFIPMSSNDCFELGRILYEEKKYSAAKDWLLEAYARADSDEPVQFVMKTVESLCFVYIKLNDMENAHKWAKLMFELAPDEDLTEVKEALEKKRLENEKESGREGPPQTKIENKSSDFEKLCRGEMSLPPEITHRLHCKYSTGNPFLKLAPIKTEQLYINPDIYMFYDVVSDAQIEIIKSVGVSDLKRAKVLNDVAVVDYNKRITLTSWLCNDAPTVDKLLARVEDMTGLTTTSAEKFQLAVYVPGGFYSPHYDLNVKPQHHDSKRGPRIATVMFYFSDVPQGGATVFTRIGLTVYPAKGAALFWYNTHSSGERHNNTYHGACPVLLGQKWAANLWMHAYGQEFLYPCKLDGDKMDESFVPAIWTGNELGNIHSG